MKEDDVKKFLENLSFVAPQADFKTGPLEYKILQCLIGTGSSSRLGPFPEDDVVKVILDNIRKNIQKGQPIQIVSAWGGKKTLSGIKQEVDIAEYFTMLQYLAIYKAVKNIYSPGLEYNIFIGDAYYRYLYGDDPGVYIYHSRLKSLAKIFGVSCFNLFSLEEIHRRDSTLLNECENNCRLLSDYWKESANICEENWKRLESYKNLCNSGWLGEIPTVMREHYLKRLNLLFPDFSLEEKIFSIVKFFAYGMMVSQNDLFGRKDPTTCTADFCLLRIPPPGMPKNLHENRLRKRILPVKFSKKTAPPWAIAGALTFKGASYKPLLIFDIKEILLSKRETLQIELFGKFKVEIDLLNLEKRSV